MSGGFADLLAEHHRDSFGIDKAMRDLQVLEHSIGIDFQADEDSQHAMQRASAQSKQLGQGLPFGMPSTQSSFVFLRHRSEHGGGEGGRARRR